MEPVLTLNTAHITRFLKYLCWTPTGDTGRAIISCAWFFSDNKEIVPEFGSRTHPLNLLVSELKLLRRKFPDRNVEMHVAVNETNGKGKTLECIKNPRVILVDIDTPTDREKIKILCEVYTPGLVVRSSPDKYHLYWKISPTIPLEVWSQLQLAFNHKLGGDLEKAQTTTLIRVPGFPRLTKDNQPFMPEVVYLKNGPPQEFDFKQLADRFKWLPIETKRGEKVLRLQRTERAKAAAELVKHLGAGKGKNDFTSLKFTPIQEGERNQALYGYIKEFTYQSGIDDFNQVLSFGLALNQKFNPPLPDKEAQIAIQSGWKNGLARTDKERERIETLTSVPAVPIDSARTDTRAKRGNVGGGGGGVRPGKRKRTRPGKTPIGSKSVRTPISSNGNGHQTQVIPHHVSAAASLFADKLWLKPKRLLKLYQNAVESGDFDAFIFHLRDVYFDIGVVGNQGPILFLRHESRWGSSVLAGTPISKDAVNQFLTETLYHIRTKAVKDKNLTRFVKEPLTYTKKIQLGNAFWACLSIQPTIRRQSPNLIVFQNGTFNIETSTFTPDPLAPLKHSNPIWANFTLHNTETPIFDKYLKDWFPNDEKVKKFLMRWFGYCMSTDTSRQCFGFFFGPTGAGKGSIAQILCALVGQFNYASLGYEALQKNFSLAAAADKLVISVEEAEATEKEHDIRMAVIKKITGGERVQIERKYAQPYEDALPGKVILQANETLKYQDRAHSIRERMIAVGFEQSYRHLGGTQPIPDIVLKTEADALATLAAITWAKAVHRKAPFNVDCRAIQVGVKEAKNKLTIASTICNEFLVVDPRASVSGQALLELGEFLRAEYGLEERIQGTGRLHVEIAAHFGHMGIKRKRKVHTHEGKKVRGFSSLRINAEKLLEEFPELAERSQDYLRDYPYLLDAIGLLEQIPTIEGILHS